MSGSFFSVEALWRSVVKRKKKCFALYIEGRQRPSVTSEARGGCMDSHE